METVAVGARGMALPTADRDLLTLLGGQTGWWTRRPEMMEETGQAEIVETLRCRIQPSVLQAKVVPTDCISTSRARKHL